MTVVTAETFKVAAQEAMANLDAQEVQDGDDPTATLSRDRIREIVKDLLLSGKVDPDTMDISEVAKRVSDNLSRMIWPERDLEVARQGAMLGVMQSAMANEITKEVHNILGGQSA